MPTPSPTRLDEIRAMRLWYHDIELPDGIRTRFADDYEANPALRGVDEGNRKMLSVLDEHGADLAGGATVLDLGCADGLFSFWAARRGARRVVGIERNAYNWRRAEWLRSVLGLGQVEFRCGGLETQLPTGPFDLVFCLGLLYHLVDPLGVLQRLRGLCGRRLMLVTAIDLPDGEGEPLARLDRYAVGSHGVWSFNVPMVRQMLSTAGFEIGHEDVEERTGGRRYSAVCRPGEASHHHIFADTIDQEFPININARQDRVIEAWATMASKKVTPVAIFGAGTHTQWLLERVRHVSGVDVRCILDDRIPPMPSLCGIPIRRPTDIDPATLSAVVISSWHQGETLHRRAAQLFGDHIPIVSLDTC